MPNIENMPRPEIILVADTVAREKNIDKEDVFVAMEVAIPATALNTTSARKSTAKPAPLRWNATAKWSTRWKTK